MITELKEEILFKHIFNSTIEGILVVDYNSNIIKANSASEKIFGFNNTELLDKKIETLIYNSFKTKENRTLNLYGYKKDGSKIPVEINTTESKINNKKVLIIFINDIVKRTKAHQEFLASKRIMNETQKLAHVGNWHWNLLTNERTWSDEYYRICGLKPGDKKLNADTVMQFLHPKDRKSAIKTVKNAIEKQTHYKYKKRILRLDGTIRHIITKGKIFFNKDGKPTEMFGTLQDITTHKEIEKKLKKSKKRNQNILETLPDLMILYDKYGNHLEFHVPDGQTLEKNIGENIDKILPKKVCRKIRKAFRKCKKTKKTQIVEYSLKENTKLKHLESRIAITDEGHFLSIIRDITKNKNSEKVILENEQRLKLTLEAGKFGSWDWSLSSNKIIRDAYQNSLLDINNQENTNTFSSFLKKIHPEDKENVQLTILEAIKNESSYTIEYRVIHNDLSIHWLHEKGNVFKNKQGKPLRIIGVTNSITKKKRAEEKLKESEERLRNYTIKLEEKVKERTKELTTTVQKLVASNLSLEDQILITEEAETIALNSKQLISDITKNFPKGFVAVVDKEFKIVFIEGEEFDELHYKSYPEKKLFIDEISIVQSAVKTKVKNKIEKSLKGKHCSFEVEFQDKTYLVNTTPLFNVDKKITQVLLVYNNITDQKQAELKILNTLKVEQELGELKSRFISMASHEFRTPLSAILSSAILIEKQNEVGKEEKRLKHVKKIRTNVKNLVVILNDFLSLSKLEEGKVIMQPTKFNIIAFSKSLIDEIKGIKKNGQTILFNSNKMEQEVFIDKKLFRHIAFNLLSNAIKYSAEKKEITFKIESNKSQLKIEIIDQGIGIPKEDQANMFQRFYRANNAANIEGTGLGLNIVKQYIELMGGNIKFKSELNIGSTFYVELPLK
jgi:PAS domain S-box-containing protein